MPGSRAAIDAALDRLYPGTRDYRYGLQPKNGTPPPIAEVVVHRATKPVPHWHYVTYGLTELEEKVSRDEKLSGFGVEYTLRLVDDAKEPPSWPITLLRWLSLVTTDTRHPYDPNHSTNLPPHYLDEVSPGVEGLMFQRDRDLGKIESTTGAIELVTAVPLMEGELALIASWSAEKLAKEIGDQLWRRERRSVLVGPRADAIREQVAREGSSQAADYIEFEHKADGIVVDRDLAIVLDRVLRHRTAHGRDHRLISGPRTTLIEPGPWHFSEGRLALPKTEARALADELQKAATGSTVARAGGVRFVIVR